MVECLALGLLRYCKTQLPVTTLHRDWISFQLTPAAFLSPDSFRLDCPFFQDCLDMCARWGDKYALVTLGDICHCFDESIAYLYASGTRDGTCDWPCGGVSSERCGGYESYDLYVSYGECMATVSWRGKLTLGVVLHLPLSPWFDWRFPIISPRPLQSRAWFLL